MSKPVEGDPARPAPPPPPAKRCIVKTSSAESVKENVYVEIVKQVDGDPVRSAPPPVPEKRWSVKRGSTESGDENGPLEIVKIVTERSLADNDAAAPPLVRPRQEKVQGRAQEENLDAGSLRNWWKGVSHERGWKELERDLMLRSQTKARAISGKAQLLGKALQVYPLLMSDHLGALRDHTDQLLCIADKLDKVSKGTKIAGITGGTTTVAGGVAAVAGVILSPFTLGASLALTAVGVGVAAAGGATGASAAIAYKVNFAQVKKKIEAILQDYTSRMSAVEACLRFIGEGAESLKQHELPDLSRAAAASAAVGRVINLAVKGGVSARAMQASADASGMIRGFALGMDFFFTNGKKGQKLKKGLESKFAQKLRKLTEVLRSSLDELERLFS